MAIRDILVSLDASASGEGRLRLALGLARAHKARLTAIYVMPRPHSVAPPVGLGAVMPNAVETVGVPLAAPPAAPADPERAERSEADFKSELQTGGIEGEWYLLDDGDMAQFVEYANTVDLTILGQQAEGAPAGGVAGFHPDDVVVAVGRPVLIVPYAGVFATVGRHVLIGWDGSREAARALNDALPLIERAEATTLCYFGRKEFDLEVTRPALDRILRHLQRHGVEARLEETPRGDTPISDLILSRAADLGADLIVAGAYHHSRVREALLGGVSRELLRHMTVPVLMSH